MLNTDVHLTHWGWCNMHLHAIWYIKDTLEATTEEMWFTAQSRVIGRDVIQHNGIQRNAMQRNMNLLMQTPICELFDLTFFFPKQSFVALYINKSGSLTDAQITTDPCGCWESMMGSLSTRELKDSTVDIRTVLITRLRHLQTNVSRTSALSLPQLDAGELRL